MERAASSQPTATLDQQSDEPSRDGLPLHGDGSGGSNDSHRESHHNLPSEPSLVPEPTFLTAEMRARAASTTALKEQGEGIITSKGVRPPPVSIPPSSVNLTNVGLSPFNNLTPLDNGLHTSTHKLMLNSPTADMPLLSPFLHANGGVKADPVAPPAQGNRTVNGHTKADTNGNNVDPLDDGIQIVSDQWAMFADKIADLEEEEAEQEVTFLADALIHGQHGAAQRRQMQRRTPAHPLLSTLSTSGRLGAARAELFSQDGASNYQVHCYAPGATAPVIISEYNIDVEACIASEQANMMMEANPQLVNGTCFMHPPHGPPPPPPPHLLPPHLPHGSSGPVGTPGYRPGHRVEGPPSGPQSGPFPPHNIPGLPPPLMSGMRPPFPLMPPGGGLRLTASPAAPYSGGRHGQQGGAPGPFPFSMNGPAYTNPNHPSHGMGNGMPGGQGTPGMQYNNNSNNAARTRFLGVDWDDRRQGWAAFVEEGQRKKPFWLMQLYPTAEAAARARDRELIRRGRHMQERLNFPEEVQLMHQQAHGTDDEQQQQGSQGQHQQSQGRCKPHQHFKPNGYDDDDHDVMGQGRRNGGGGGGGLGAGGAAGRKRGATPADTGNGSDAGQSKKRGRHGGSGGQQYSVQHGDSAAYMDLEHQDPALLHTSSMLTEGSQPRDSHGATGVPTISGRSVPSIAVSAARRPGASSGLVMMASNSSSKYRGVHWSNSGSAWAATVWDRDNGSSRRIGTFDSEEAAARAWDREMVAVLGLQARQQLNFPDSFEAYMSQLGLHAPHSDNTTSCMSGMAPGPLPGQTSSMYRGVTWAPHTQCWEARVFYSGQLQFLGSFPTEYEAAVAYDRAVLRLRGSEPRSRSRMNFPLAGYMHDSDTDGDQSQQYSQNGQQQQSVSMGTRSDGLLGFSQGHEYAPEWPATGLQLTRRRDRRSKLRNMSRAQPGDVGTASDATLTDDEHDEAAENRPPFASCAASFPAQQQQQSQDTCDPVTQALYMMPHYNEPQQQQGRMNSSISSFPHILTSVQGYDMSVSTQEAGTEKRPSRSTRRTSQPAEAGRVDSPAPSASAQTDGGNAQSNGNARVGVAKSHFKGVSWCDKAKKWRAVLWDGSKQKFLGHYSDEVEAARAHDRAILELKGPEAKTNFPHSEYEAHKQQQQRGVVPAAVDADEGDDDDDGVAVDVTLGETHTKWQGVRYNRSKGGWDAEFIHNDTTYTIGPYPTDILAARAHDCACLYLHTPADNMNFSSITYPQREVDDVSRRVEEVLAGVNLLAPDGKSTRPARVRGPLQDVSMSMTGHISNYDNVGEGDGRDHPAHKKTTRRRSDSQGTNHPKSVSTFVFGGESAQDPCQAHVVAPPPPPPSALGPASKKSVSEQVFPSMHVGMQQQLGSRSIMHAHMCMIEDDGHVNPAVKELQMDAWQSARDARDAPAAAARDSLISPDSMGRKGTAVPGRVNATTASMGSSGRKKQRLDSSDQGDAARQHHLADDYEDNMDNDEDNDLRPCRDNNKRKQPSKMSLADFKQQLQKRSIHSTAPALAPQDQVAPRDQYSNDPSAPVNRSWQAPTVSQQILQRKQQGQCTSSHQKQQSASRSAPYVQPHQSALKLPTPSSTHEQKQQAHQMQHAAGQANHNPTWYVPTGLTNHSRTPSQMTTPRDERAVGLSPGLDADLDQSIIAEFETGSLFDGEEMGHDMFKLPSPRFFSPLSSLGLLSNEQGGKLSQMLEGLSPDFHLTSHQPPAQPNSIVQETTNLPQTQQEQEPKLQHEPVCKAVYTSSVSVAPVSARTSVTAQTAAKPYTSHASAAAVHVAPPSHPAANAHKKNKRVKPQHAAAHHSAPRTVSASAIAAVEGNHKASPQLQQQQQAGNATSGTGGASVGRGKSQYRGVSWHVVNNKYIARIRTNTGGNTHLGCFDTPEQAAKAYDVAAIALRGSAQAVTNYPVSEYLGEDGYLRPELLELLSKASTPITPITAATAGTATVKRRAGSGRAASAGVALATASLHANARAAAQYGDADCMSQETW